LQLIFNSDLEITLNRY